MAVTDNPATATALGTTLESPMFNFDDPFYRPLWLRILIAGICIGWGIFEFVIGTPGFAILFLAVGGYAAYRFFITFDPDASSPSED